MSGREPTTFSRFIASLDDGDRVQIDQLEGNRRQLGGSRITNGPVESRTGLVSSMRTWQWVVSAMEGGWTPPDTSTVHEYLDELTARDRLDGFRRNMRDPLRYKFDAALTELDQRFRSSTIYDGGVELAQYWGPLAEGEETRWYWLRKPIDLPAEW